LKGSTVYRNRDTGIEVTVSKPAEELIGPARVGEFVNQLTELLKILGPKRAYVSKSGWSVEIYFTLPWILEEKWEIPVRR